MITCRQGLLQWPHLGLGMTPILRLNKESFFRSVTQGRCIQFRDKLCFVVRRFKPIRKSAVCVVVLPNGVGCIQKYTVSRPKILQSTLPQPWEHQV